jgi:TPR repeat protein
VPPPGLSADEDLQCKYAFVAKIEELVKAGRQAEADLGMERYFANYPTDTSVMPDLLADTYLGLRPPDLERAVSTRARVSRNRGDYTRLLTDLMLRDEWERADFYVGIALGIDPENPDYRARRESIDKALGKQPPAPPPAAVAPESKAFPNSAIAVDVLNKALELYNSGQRKEAVEQFLIAAEAGNTEAQMNLAGIYWQGDERAGYPKDLQKALKWMKAAAAQNQPLAISFVPMIEKELKAQNAPAK